MEPRTWGIIGGIALVVALLSPFLLGSSKSVQTLYDDAEVMFERKDYQGAIEKYNKAIKASKKPGARTEIIDKDFSTLANYQISVSKPDPLVLGCRHRLIVPDQTPKKI